METRHRSEPFFLRLNWYSGAEISGIAQVEPRWLCETLGDKAMLGGLGLGIARK